MWLFTSYGFMYEVERGNIDLYALFFALLAVWLMVKLPRSPWWPAIALAVSINLKLYPGVLLLLLFWRYRWKAVVPVLVTNVVLLLITGPGNVLNTLTGQSSIQSSLRPLWWGNHSASALANVLHQLHGWPSAPLYVVFLLVPLAIWALTMVVLIRRGWSDRTAVLAAAACVPVMSVVPAISHDYKLVLYVFPLAVLVGFVAVLTRRDLLAWSVVFGLTAWAMLQLSRSSLVTQPALWNSKWAMIVLVQALLLTVSWWSGKDARAFELEMAAGTDGRAAADAVEEVDDADAALAAGPAAAAAAGSPAPAAGWLARLAGTAASAGPDAMGGPESSTAAGAAGAADRAGAPAMPWMNRRMLCIILLLLAVVLGANFWVGIVRSTFNDLNSGIGVPQHDFFQYYAGGHNWNLGLDPYLNHPGAPGVIEHPRHDKSDISGYIYPPTLLPLFGALSGTDYDTARGVWLGLNVVAFGLMVLVAVLVSRRRRLEVLTAAVLLTMVSFAFFYHVHEGQIDMIVAALSVSAFLLYPRWKGWPSAALLALAIATKVSPVVLVAVIALYYRDWRFVLKTAALVVALVAVSLPFVDLSLYRAYVTDILPAISGLRSLPLQPDATSLLVEVPDGGQARLGAGLCRAAVPGLGDGEELAPPAAGGAARRPAHRAQRRAAACGRADAAVLAAGVADGVRVGDRAAGSGAHGAAAPRQGVDGAGHRGRRCAALDAHVAVPGAGHDEHHRRRRHGARTHAVLPAAGSGEAPPGRGGGGGRGPAEWPLGGPSGRLRSARDPWYPCARD